MIARYWKQFFATIIIILGVVLVTWLLAKSSINSYSQSMSRNLLQQVKSTVNMRLEEVNNTAVQMSFSKNLSILRRSDDLFSNDMASTTYDYEQNLEDYGLYNQYIVLNFVVFFKSRYVIMPKSGQDLISFCNLFRDSTTNTAMTPTSFAKYVFMKNNIVGKTLLYKQNDKYIEVLPFIKWVGESGKDNSGAIIILIDSSKLTELLNQSVTTKKSVFAVTDSAGNVILSNHKVNDGEANISKQNLQFESYEKKLSNGRMVFESNSDFNDWRFVLISDISEVNSNLNDLMILILLVCVLFILIVVAALISMVRKNQSLLMPIYKIINLDDIQKYQLKKDDIYGYLKDSVNQLLNDKNYLNTTLESQMPVIREVLLNNMLKGELFDVEDIKQNMQKFGFTPENDYYCVAIVSFNLTQTDTGSESVLGEAKNAFKQALKHFSKAVLTCDLNKYDIALIINLSSSDENSHNKEFISDILTSLVKLINENYSFRLRITVGSTYYGEKGISRSYEEAKSIQGMNLMEPVDELEWYDKTNITNSAYYYPIELETRLINTIKSGNRSGVEEVIKEIFNINLKEKNISSEVLTVFLHDFYGSILKALSLRNENSSLRNEIYKMFTTNYEKIGTLEFQTTFLDYIYRLCDSFNQNQKSHNEVLANKIKGYIQENYPNYELSLTSVADEFHISSGYLSIFFKEQVGDSFSDYLMKIRLGKAKELLNTTNLSVNDIAVKIGYGSTNTFCRAFKRFYGISAMEMKNTES